MKEIIVNARILSSPLTGQPRYLREMLARLSDDVEAVAPRMMSGGLGGHAWEQLVLPARVGGRLLWSPSTTGPLALSRQVVTIHDTAPLDHPEWFGRKFAAWYQFLVPRVVRRSAAVIAISNFCRERIVEHCAVSPDEITVIPNGVDDHFSPRSREEVETVVRALQIPTDFFLLTVASIEPRKNLGRLLQAWREIQSHVPEHLWLVVAGGRGPERVFAGVDLDIPPRVHFTGPVEDVHLPTLYSAAMGFVFVSLYEGFGLPPLEAMSCGTPVMTGDRASLPEVVGDAALLVDPTRVDAIVAGLRRMSDDSALRTELARRGQLQARLFSWNESARLVREVLHRTAAN
jgi:glycosyltransferase involved in cell wall biosynthesis